ncbi:MAG: dihydroneopterin aldolase [Pseudobdellovibrionaceae bacterium]
MPSTFSSELSIDELSYHVSLGCSEQERSLPQEVLVSVTLNFPSLPVACETDLLKNTVCYADIEKKISELCRTQSFSTIENLGYLCTKTIQPACPPGTHLRVKVHKLNPPLGRKSKGATFVLEGKI